LKHAERETQTQNLIFFYGELVPRTTWHRCGEATQRGLLKEGI
jgi:hypothetical protein